MNKKARATTIASLQQLCARLETLGHLEIADLRLPGQQKRYEQTLEDASAALTQVETALDKLGQELEFQHQRLGEVRDQDHEEERGTRGIEPCSSHPPQERGGLSMSSENVVVSVP